MALLSWLDDRTGVRGMTRAMLYEHIPGGARWRYVWGSTLVFCFAVQMITGFVLWMHYSPSSQTAWESVYYIQHEMSFGWLLRGIHHYTAQAMIVLLALHMLQVIIDGAYRAPREVNFWIGLLLLQVVLGLSLTGYLLPWDQKGYWATKVATSLIGVIPGVGPVVQRLVVGGPDYGHHTLTRFFALHAGLLPFLMIVLIAAHVYVFRRHGIHAREPKRGGDSYFWPDQVLKDAVACLGVLAVVLLLCLKFGLFNGGFSDPGKLGAPLSAPADPSEPFGAARPEWYFLFLFQFLKAPWFAGSQFGELLGAVIIPGGVLVLMFLMPFTGRFRVGHWFNVFLTVLLATATVLLTTMAIVEDVGFPQLRSALLGRVGARSLSGLIVLMLAGVVLLLAAGGGFGGKLRPRFTFALLAVLIAGVGAGLVVVAGGGVAPGDPVLRLGNVSLDLLQVLLFALLLALALLITVALVRQPRPAVRGGDVTDELLGHAQPQSQPGRWGRLSERLDLGPRLVLAALIVVAAGVVFLTAVRTLGGTGKADFAAAVQQAERESERVVALASGPDGIPPQGAVWLLRNDPFTQGPKLFARNCASCHRFNGHNGLGQPVPDPQSAPDLAHFASRDWVRDMLDPKLVDSVKFFGPEMKAHTGEMVEFVKDNMQEMEPQDVEDLKKIIVALSAEAGLTGQRADDLRDAETIKAGRTAMTESAFECTDCHDFHGEKTSRSITSSSRGPDLTGYGSRQWTIDFIKNPEHPRFYPGDKNDRMPLYGVQNILDDRSIELIVDWMRGDTDPSRRPTAPATAPATTAPSTMPATTAPATTAPATTSPATTAPAATAPTETKPETKPEPAKEQTKPDEPKPEAKPEMKKEEPAPESKPETEPNPPEKPDPAEKPSDEAPAPDKPAEEKPSEEKPAKSPSL
ncbi:MAG TPA: cytochrome b N-terminal domain-containing protein [Tepidisphaeraceae bacterium]|nr:cytochrome b N-terminal domain-containing protein [Tepidisphaeraceae bacterium]